MLVISWMTFIPICQVKVKYKRLYAVCFQIFATQKIKVKLQ